ncbi:MAG: glycosyltransferase [bacterium]|nr:glycosyltransferase [bacterium]
MSKYFLTVEKKEIKKLPITAVMVIHNEEAIIKRALQSCFNVADEIIVIHDGKCQDRSLDIARKYTDKIFKLEHVGAAERHRPFAYEKAKNNWILQLDADEYLSDSLRENLQNLIEDDVDVYDISWSTFYKNKHFFWYYKRMLFKKNAVFFIGVTHECVKPVNEKIRIKKIEYVLMHEPVYNNTTMAVFKKKWKKLAKIQAKQLLEDFSDIPKWNCRMTDWERHRKIRIRHPIVMGILATTFYNAFFSIKNFLVYRKIILLKMGFLSLLYHANLYYYLFIFKKRKKSKIG